MTSDGEIALVTRVKDGDSLQIKTSKGEKDLRILGIDAPELSQPFGKEAKETLQTLVENKNVTIVEPITDKYRRDLAYVLLTNTAFPKGIDVGAYMLEQGYAWYFNPDPKKDESYKKLEREARRKKKGLWSQDNPQEPVDYRHEEKSKSSKRFKFE
jgi:endonuclease YncB( thermonuclease family)